MELYVKIVEGNMHLKDKLQGEGGQVSLLKPLLLVVSRIMKSQESKVDKLVKTVRTLEDQYHPRIVANSLELSQNALKY